MVMTEAGPRLQGMSCLCRMEAEGMADVQKRSKKAERLGREMKELR